MAVTILIDTNVLLDDLMVRKPHDKDSRQIMDACKRGEIIGVLAAHSFPDMFYIMRKFYTAQIRKNLLRALCDMFQVIELDGEKISAAIDDHDFADFEDCLQEKCAISARADYIVTWNTSDYSKSSIPALTPTEFLAKYADMRVS